MKTRKYKYLLCLALTAGLAWMTACSAKSTEASASADAEKSLGEKLREAVSSEVEIPAGTELQVRLGQPVGSARSTVGEKFEVALHTP